jgi:hypothetical protein
MTKSIITNVYIRNGHMTTQILSRLWQNKISKEVIAIDYFHANEVEYYAIDERGASPHILVMTLETLRKKYDPL